MAKTKPDHNFVRVTISIPRTLKGQMDLYDAEVVWSKVAAEAFDRKVRELELRKKESGAMPGIVARLKKAKEKNNDEMYQAGFKAGKAWVGEDGSAEPVELERLAEIKEDRDLGWSEWNAESLFAQINPDCDVNRHDIANYWEGALGLETKQYAAIADQVKYWEGVIDGAYDVWTDVRDQLE